MKECTKCRLSKPPAAFAKNQKTKDGLQYWCRECNRACMAAWVAADPERARRGPREWARKNPEANRARVAAWKQENPERVRARDAAYRAANVDRMREFSVRYRAANAEKLRAYFKGYREQNPERKRATNQAWKLANRGRVLEAVTFRKSRVRRATPKWLTKEQRAQIAYLYECAAALRDCLGEPYHVDHIVPLIGVSVCGLHVPWNLQILTAAANLAKGNKITLAVLK